MIPRTLGRRLAALTGSYPVVFLTGPRQSGKTTLARATFRSYRYVSLEDLQNREEARDDPRGFLRRLRAEPGVVLDEAQHGPELFSYLQVAVDEGRGPFVLTGSQQFSMSERIGQSLAGRAAILELLPFSVAELCGRSARAPDALLDERETSPPSIDLASLLFTGTFPRIHDKGLDAATWLDGYVRTYVERDVRTVAGVGDLESFSRFLGLCAGRAGQLLNLSSLGSDAGVSHVTVKRWLSILQASYIIDLLRPHHESFSKRLVKSPKIHFVDSGLLCHLLRIRKPEDLIVHPLRGAVFESFVVSEYRKTFLHHGERPPVYFWRDSHGREVDLLVDLGRARIPIEAKAGETVASDALQGLDYYTKLSRGSDGILVYGGSESYRRGSYLLRAWHDLT